MTKLLAFLVLAAMTVEVKTPTLTVEQKKDFFKSQAVVNGTQVLLERTAEFRNHEKAQQDFQKVIESLSKACGENYQLALDAVGEPFCQDKPKQPEPQKPK